MFPRCYDKPFETDIALCSCFRGPGCSIYVGWQRTHQDPRKQATGMLSAVVCCFQGLLTQYLMSSFLDFVLFNTTAKRTCKRLPALFSVTQACVSRFQQATVYGFIWLIQASGQCPDRRLQERKYVGKASAVSSWYDDTT